MCLVVHGGRKKRVSASVHAFGNRGISTELGKVERQGVL